MIKFLLSFFTILGFFSLSAQNNFEYQRTWGTYFGPVGAKSWNEYTVNPIYFDSQNNIYTNGQVNAYNNYPNSYYDQFIIGNGQPFHQISTASSWNPYSNVTNAKFSPSGTLQKFEYYSNIFSPQGYRKTLRYIDNNDNKYYEYSNIVPLAPTSGTWFTSPPVNNAMLLVKESPTGILQWATYIPSTNLEITGDNNGNMYVAGNTTVKQGITTANVYQENFISVMNGGQEIQNGYIVKLNSSGQRVWGTYFPGYINKMKYFDNNLYFLVQKSFDNSQLSIATTNAFQSTAANYYIQKFNANNGSQVWGNFYGKAGSENHYRMYNLAVNEFGLYVIGDANGDNNSNVQNYFSTAGAHQQNIGGSWDIFLSKFNLNGNRDWSTYFGSTGTDLLQGNTQPIALSGEDVYFCGYTWGIGNSLATPGSYQPTQQFNNNNSTNQFFVKFNKNGSLVWSSYYGGTNTTYNTPINIAVHNSALYLYGETTSSSGFASPNCWQPQMIDPNPSITNQEKNVTFLAKFEPKTLSTSDYANSQKLILYDNPNNGNFILKGDILKKEKCVLSVYDMSGKLIHKQNLSSAQLQNISLKGKLLDGTYMVKLNTLKGEPIATIKMSVKH